MSAHSAHLEYSCAASEVSALTPKPYQMIIYKPYPYQIIISMKIYKF